MTTHLVMGTRGSALALAQARMVARELERLHPGLTVEERIIRTTGDKQQGKPLPEIGGKGVFTLEIEAALLNGEIHFAVHSLKDLPPLMPEGLTLAAVPKRESPLDVLILRSDLPSAQTKIALPILPVGAVVGTSSLRRAAQLRHIRPDLQIRDIRGNIDTRIKKLETEGYDAIVLAHAGLNRLGLTPERVEPLDAAMCVPAPAQGALALQSRIDDLDTRSVLMGIEDSASRSAIEAERAVVQALNAGCSTPLGVLAHARDNFLMLHAVVLDPAGLNRIGVSMQGVGDPQIIGQSAADSLHEKGAFLLLEN